MDWTWDLTVLYKDFDDPRIEADFARLKELCAQARETLNREDPDARAKLEACAGQQEELSRLSSALGEFAYLTLATDATNEKAQNLMDRLEIFSVQLELLSSALTRYIGGVENLDAVIGESESLKKVAFFLRRSRETCLAAVRAKKLIEINE